jgi:hypothetical protein
MMMQVKEMKRRIAADSSTKLSSSNKKQIEKRMVMRDI